MRVQTTFTLTLGVDSEKYNKLLDKALAKSRDIDQPEEDTFVDLSLASKGIIVTFRDGSRKKKIKLTITGESDIDKLERRVDRYFNSKVTLNDFRLSKMTLVTDIDVGENAAAYLRVLHKVRKVKGFSPLRDDWLEDDVCFGLEGNSNGIEFLVYDLERAITEHSKKAKGILRAEVRLTVPKAIRLYTCEYFAPGQMAMLLDKREDVFLDIFTRVVPFGDFYKKEKAVEIIRREVKDRTIRRRCLRLLDLVPEKKSLLLAVQALNYRRVDRVIAAFEAIDLAPVTLGKRCELKRLENLYKFL